MRRITEKDLPTCYALIQERYENQRRLMKTLMPFEEIRNQILEEVLLKGMIADTGELSFIAGYEDIEHFKSPHKGVYIPWYGIGYKSAEGLDKLLQACTIKWLERGHAVIGVTLFEGEKTIRENFFDAGYGSLLEDGFIRDFKGQETKKCRLILGPTKELDELGEKLRNELAGPPTFLLDLHYEPLEEQNRYSVVMEVEGEVIGGISGLKGHSPGASYLTGQDSIGIDFAYVDPTYRGAGSLLLQHFFSEMKALGIIQIQVDYETANRAGKYFWRKNFEIPSLTLLHRMDTRIVNHDNK